MKLNITIDKAITTIDAVSATFGTIANEARINLKTGGFKAPAVGTPVEIELLSDDGKSILQDITGLFKEYNFQAYAQQVPGPDGALVDTTAVTAWFTLDTAESK